MQKRSNWIKQLSKGVWRSNIQLFPTCCFLKGFNGLLKPSLRLLMAPCANLGVEGSDVEQNTSFFQQQVLLADGNTSERVVPSAKTETKPNMYVIKKGGVVVVVRGLGRRIDNFKTHSQPS